MIEPKETFTNYLAILGILAITFWLGFFVARVTKDVPAEQRTEARQNAIKKANDIIKSYQAALDSTNEALFESQQDVQSLKDSMASVVDSVRKTPIKYAPVSTIEVAECDSAKAVGAAVSKENDALKSALEDSREWHQAKDTAIADLSAELDSCDVEHGRKDALIASKDKDIEKEADRKKFWRRASATILVVAIVIITTLVL